MRFSIIFLFVFLWLSCKKETPPVEPVDAVSQYLTIEKTAPDYGFEQPAGFTLLNSDLQVDNQKAQLGRVLFFDKKLSKDGTVSCGTCHQQAFGFADPAPISRGVFGKKGTRNTMALGSFASLRGFLGLHQDGFSDIPLFWDSRSLRVDDQVQQAFTNEKEMGMTMPEVLAVAGEHAYYPPLFEAAFGDSVILEERVYEALLHFMGAMHSFDSRYNTALDKAGDKTLDFPDFTEAENIGKALYLQHCELCHGSLNSPQLIFEAKNGLDSVYADIGKEAISGNFFDNGTFKVPALRNIALTAPYMHDGRFADLSQVIEHYNSGVIRSFGLHGDLLTSLGNGAYVAKKLNLSQAEKDALKAFLLTLTDEGMATDVRFSDPFR